jgi:hypothetical protein
VLAHVTIRFSVPFSDTYVVARTFTTVANARLFVAQYCNHCYREYRLEGSLDHSWISGIEIELCGDPKRISPETLACACLLPVVMPCV